MTQEERDQIYRDCRDKCVKEMESLLCELGVLEGKLAANRFRQEYLQRRSKWLEAKLNREGEPSGSPNTTPVGGKTEA